MKTLVLFRHAKSSWKHPVEDIHRPLSSRGIRQSQQVARAIALPKPDKILTSPANRALSTCAMFVEECDLDWACVEVKPAIYMASQQDLFELIQSTDNHIERLWVFGHNPGLNDLAELCCDQPLPNIITSGFAHLNCMVDHWCSIEPGHSNLVELNLRDAAK